MYVHVQCMYIHVCMYMHIHVCMYIYMYVCICMYIHVCMYVRMYMHVRHTLIVVRAMNILGDAVFSSYCYVKYVAPPTKLVLKLRLPKC